MPMAFGLILCSARRSRSVQPASSSTLRMPACSSARVAGSPTFGKGQHWVRERSMLGHVGLAVDCSKV